MRITTSSAPTCSSGSFGMRFGEAAGAGSGKDDFAEELAPDDRETVILDEWNRPRQLWIYIGIYRRLEKALSTY